MERKALLYVKAHGMLEKGDRIVVGVSGGADSMCLLSMLISWQKRYGLTLVVVHINHGIRGESANRDEEYVRSFCEERNLPFVAVHADVPALVEEKGGSEEEVGRNLRYEEFLKACREYNCNKIAVAHNRDDNAETVLFNMFRGSGISGIKGIVPTRERDGITIIRPLLGTSRAEIEEYLAKHNTDYVTDETNLETEYSRNRIRNKVIPYVKESINQGASKHIAELASQAQEMEELVDEMTSKHMLEMEKQDALIYEEIAGAITSIRIETDKLLSVNKVIRRRVIRELVGKIAGGLKDISSSHIEAVVGLLERGVGKKADLPYNIIVKREYNYLVLKLRKKNTGKKTEEKSIKLGIECKIPGTYELDGNGHILKLSLIKPKKNADIPKNNYTKWYDYDKIKGTIVIRNRKEGDYLLVKASSEDKEQLKRKSLKSYLIDKKIDRELRDDLPLLTEDSHVLWIIGDRRDDSYCVTEETKRILCVTTESK